MNVDNKKSRASVIQIKSQLSRTDGKSLANIGRKSISRMRMRKQSYGFSRVDAVRAAERRASQAGIEFRRPPLVFSNTYQLWSHHKFNLEEVTKIIETVLDDAFEDHVYNGEESPIVTMRIAAEIMRDIKAMAFNRYRIISICTVGQKRSQSYNNAISFLWDHERDLYADVQRQTTTAFVHCTVFGVYT